MLLGLAAVLSCAARWGLSADVTASGSAMMQDLSEALAWMRIVASSDPDPACRSLASRLLAMSSSASTDLLF